MRSLARSLTLSLFLVISGSQVETYAQIELAEQNTPAVDGEEGDLERVVVPSCPDVDLSTAKIKQGAKFHGDIPWGNICIRKIVPVTIIFHYVSNGFLFTFPTSIQKRVESQVSNIPL